jgi:hypothetical protein
MIALFGHIFPQKLHGGGYIWHNNAKMHCAKGYNVECKM